jgi:hypothetical protein
MDDSDFTQHASVQFVWQVLRKYTKKNVIKMTDLKLKLMLLLFIPNKLSIKIINFLNNSSAKLITL